MNKAERQRRTAGRRSAAGVKRRNARKMSGRWVASRNAARESRDRPKAQVSLRPMETKGKKKPTGRKAWIRAIRRKELNRKASARRCKEEKLRASITRKEKFVTSASRASKPGDSQEERETEENSCYPLGGYWT